MTKILDKKQTVIDFQLTGYGKYLMSIGQYAPEYYAFYDDNVVYDNQYNNISESQNSINERIKDETPYISTLTLFEDIDSTQQQLVRSEPEDVFRTDLDEEGRGSGATFRFTKADNYFLSDITPTKYMPRKDIFRYGAAIGDALLDAKETDTAPAWKVIVLNGEITSTETLFEVPANVSGNIPQINIAVDYKKEIRDSRYPTRKSDQISIDDTSPRAEVNSTINFQDENFVYLSAQDPVVYIDEVNTELLSENYDVEVFVVSSASATSPPTLERKYFETIDEQIVNGMMVRANPDQNFTGDLPRTSVEYYFDFKSDRMADRDIVCRQLQNYNKTSYYIDLDIDCSGRETDDVYFDIYGSQVEPEICLD
ncbi:MAG: hypothetical protein ACW99G_08935 [Candidatus Thorarchaeota archaeon]|jgi:hypothetical protein